MLLSASCQVSHLEFASAPSRVGEETFFFFNERTEMRRSNLQHVTASRTTVDMFFTGWKLEIVANFQHLSFDEFSSDPEAFFPSRYFREWE